MTSPQITEVRRLYAEAEDAIKLYERIGLDNLASAINELRYAGEHVLVADTADDESEKSFALVKAMRHCERARYDALEATIVTLLDFLANFRQSDLTMDEMTAIFPAWKECLAKASAAQRIVETSGAVKNADSKALKSAIEDLLAFRYQLIAVEPQILEARKRAFEKREAERRAVAEIEAADAERRETIEKTMSDRQFLLSFSATIAGTAVGLVGTLIAIATAFPTQRLVGISLGLIGFALVCFGVYCWSSRNLLLK